jgi:hypothetical protein
MTGIAPLLQSQDEPGILGLMIGLIANLLVSEPRRERRAARMLVHMRTAQRAIFLRGLIVPFTLLVYDHRDGFDLPVLESTRVSEEGRLGPDVPSNSWFENAAKFQGFWLTEVIAPAA